MKGSLRERKPGVFELRIYLGEDAVTGEHRYRSVTVRGSKRDAQTELARLVTDAQEGRIAGRKVVPGKYTLHQLIDAHLAELNGSPGTVRSYQSMHSKYIIPSIGRLPLEKLDTRVIGQFYAYLIEEHDLAPATVRRAHALIRGSLRSAVRWGWISRNPAVDAVLPRMEKVETVLPSTAQVVEAIIEADALDVDFGVFVRLAAATGARRGELCGLRWSSVDFERSVVRIETNVIPVPGGTLMKDTKNHAKRDVPLDEFTVGIIRDHHEAMVERATACGSRLVHGAFVFSHAFDGSESWHPDNASSRWATVRERTGLDGVRLHDLRHYQATMLLAAGMPVKNVSKRIGHRDAAVTLNVYAHATRELDRESADVMGGLLGARRPARPAS